MTKPEKIQINDDKMIILWSDNTLENIKLVNLRYYCPCAFCESKRAANIGFIPVYSENEIIPENVKLIGDYGITIEWKDGHKNGIYEFNYLKKFLY